LYLNFTHAHLWQDVLYLCSFVYSHPIDELVEGKTCRIDIINDKLLFIIDGGICWIK